MKLLRARKTQLARTGQSKPEYWAARGPTSRATRDGQRAGTFTVQMKHKLKTVLMFSFFLNQAADVCQAQESAREASASSTNPPLASVETLEPVPPLQDEDPSEFLIPMTSPRALPDGTRLLALNRSRLPPEPLVIDAEVKQITGRKLRRMKVRMHTHWGANPPQARYEVLAVDGSVADQLEVFWFPNQPPVVEFKTGRPLNVQENFDLQTAIRDFDLNWYDLTLSFVWWPKGRSLHWGKKLRRDVIVVEALCPAWEKSELASTHFWIDRKEAFMLMAEGFDAEGKRVRKVEIDEFKKLDGQYMATEVEVESVDPEGGKDRRVRIYVRKVKKADETP